MYTQEYECLHLRGWTKKQKQHIFHYNQNSLPQIVENVTTSVNKIEHQK